MPYTQTNTHACTQSHQMPNSQHPRDDLQTVVGKQTNPNLQQWQNWCKHGFLFTTDAVSGHFPSCVPFNVFYEWCKLCLPVNSYINQIFHQHSRLPSFAASETLETVLTADGWLKGFFVILFDIVHNSIRAGQWSPPAAQPSQEPTFWKKKKLPQERSSWRQVLLVVRNLDDRRCWVRGV